MKTNFRIYRQGVLEFYWAKKNELVRENEALNVPTLQVLAEKRSSAKKPWSAAVGVGSESGLEILGVSVEQLP